MDYQALDSSRNEIRPLTFFNLKNTSYLPLHCKLEHMSLDAVRSHAEVSDINYTSDTALGLELQTQQRPKRAEVNTADFRFEWGDYVALSYVWGETDRAHQRRIFVNGSAVSICQPNFLAVACVSLIFLLLPAYSTLLIVYLNVLDFSFKIKTTTFYFTSE
jgi:hypothetical protein